MITTTRVEAELAMGACLRQLGTAMSALCAECQTVLASLEEERRQATAREGGRPRLYVVGGSDALKEIPPFVSHHTR